MEVRASKRTLSVQLPRGMKRRRLTGSDTESIHSVQERDTDQAKDTSDSSMDSDSMTEYEVGRMSPEAPNPFFSTDDSDERNEINEIAKLGAVVAAVSVNLDDIDLGQLADTSTEPSTSPTSNSDADPELPRLDYLDFWTCSQCKAENENRHVPFCKACYTIRKTFFPPRPRRRRPQKKVSRVVDYSIPNLDSVGGDVVDGPCGSQAKTLSVESKASTDSGIDTACSSQEVDVVDGPSTSSAASTNLCQICFIRQANGLFKHGKTSHGYGCYGCAKSVWRRMGQCPLCRRKIDCVLKLL